MRRPTRKAITGCWHVSLKQAPLLATTPTASARTLTTMPNKRKSHRNMFNDCYAVDCEALHELLVPTVKIHPRIIRSMRATWEAFANIESWPLRPLSTVRKSLATILASILHRPCESCVIA